MTTAEWLLTAIETFFEFIGFLTTITVVGVTALVKMGYIEIGVMDSPRDKFNKRK